MSNPFFGEREALKLAFGESGQTVVEVPDAAKTGTMTSGAMTVRVQPLGALPSVAVPNTIEKGVHAALSYGQGGQLVGSIALVPTNPI